MPITSQFSFGTYIFPVTFQETSRVVTLAFDKKKVPFNYGESVAANTGPSSRAIEIVGPVGSMIIGSAGNTLLTAADLEAERRLLAGLQLTGRQALFVGPTQYILAYLESFEHKFWQDAFGYRYADWTLKFYADDPRYWSPAQTTTSLTGSGSTTYSFGVSTNGNVRAYPSCKFTITSGSITGPFLGVTNAASLQNRVSFSTLTMNSGDILALECDPRPNIRSIAAVYTPSGGVAQNALQFAKITDFSNNYDLTEWFPFINPPQIESGISLVYGANSGSGAYTFTAAWNDHWL